MTTELTTTIARFITGADAPAIPEDVTERATQVIADTLGVMIAGSRSEVSAPLFRYLDTRSPSDGDAPILGTDRGVQAEISAMANGTFGHALDFDEVVPTMPGHPGAIVVASLLAVPEGRRASGQQFVAAYVTGLEVAAKLGAALNLGPYRQGWHATGMVGVLGAAAAVARIRGFDVDDAARSLGLAASMSAGMTRNFGTMTKPMHSGWAAHSAVAATNLVGCGFSASTNIIDGDQGFLDLYGDGNNQPQFLAEGLGRPYVFTRPGVYLKKFPCCYALHRIADAVLRVRDTVGADADLAEVLVRVPPMGLSSLKHDRPATGLQAKFSVPYVVAAGLLDGRFTLGSFTDDAVARPEIRQFLPRVSAQEDAECSRSPDGAGDQASDGVAFPSGFGFVEVALTTGAGEDVVERVSSAPGAADRPLTWDEIEAKFLDCCAFAGFDPDHAAAGFSQVRNFATLDRIESALPELQARRR